MKCEMIADYRPQKIKLVRKAPLVYIGKKELSLKDVKIHLC